MLVSLADSALPGWLAGLWRTLTLHAEAAHSDRPHVSAQTRTHTLRFVASLKNSLEVYGLDECDS